MYVYAYNNNDALSHNCVCKLCNRHRQAGNCAFTHTVCGLYALVRNEQTHATPRDETAQLNILNSQRKCADDKWMRCVACVRTFEAHDDDDYDDDMRHRGGSCFSMES